MASFDFNPKTGKARFFFRYDRRQFNKTIPMESERHADRHRSLIESTIEDLERGRVSLPANGDVLAFIMSGGKVARPVQLVSIDPRVETTASTLGGIFDVYTSTLTPGSKEANSVYLEALHGRHLRRLIGAERCFDAIDVAVLQKYVNDRIGEGVVRDTINKELVTLRVVWRWAHQRKHLAVPLGWKLADLTMPKSHEKPPFQTWDQITRKIERDELPPGREAELWECLWLDEAQTVECLDWVKDHARRPFLYPMVAFAAYVGARRSEMLRSERDDWDLQSGVVTIRQKKVDKSRSFTRRTVAIHPALGDIMRAWFDIHPGGRWTIADEEGRPIDPRVSTGYFRRLMRDGKWSVLHGWHTFRHSLASNMASAGVDQRIINDILGHHTEEMERRYRHLLPHKQAHALHGLFQHKP